MAVFNSSIRSRVVRFSLVAISVIFAGSIAAQSRDAQIAERLQPVGEVCLAGDACAGGGGAAPMAAAGGEFTAEGTYKQNCAVCHDSGMAGAPKHGDADAWAARLADKGMETLVHNAITGINAMPPKGMCMTCSDEDMAAMVQYISGQ